MIKGEFSNSIEIKKNKNIQGTDIKINEKTINPAKSLEINKRRISNFSGMVDTNMQQKKSEI
jgi:hypothetical protein